MRRFRRTRFEPAVKPPAPPLGFKPAPAPSVPPHFMEAMQRISGTSDMAPNTQPKKDEDEDSVDKWKSSFQPIGQQNSEDSNTHGENRIELYDPCNPLSSDSEAETSQPKDCQPPPPIQDGPLRCQRLSRDLSPGHILPKSRAYSPENKPLDHPGYDFKSGHAEPRVRSPDRFIHGSSIQGVPEAFRGPSSNERKPLPDYPRAMAATLRVSPPRLKRDHQQLGYVERTGLDQDPPPLKLTRTKGDHPKLDKCPINCDLCDVELSNALELEEHLESKTHWDIMEHIQQSSNYDDMAIAFLQEVMVYKSQHCSRAVEENAFPVLQENHHMTKVEMLHCAACKVYVCASASEVQTHIASLEHLSKAKEFEVQQRRSCLGKAEAMLKKLQPQFELFLKGACPFD